ncbi:MAG: hypothetical protein MI922_11510, partial [Bacteroidales bacterium]|nr:hypothetical protein [Bacteroidales bacterium]
MKKQAIELEELGSKIYNNVQAIVYAADMDTYELVYINAYTQEVIGAEPGKKCYQAIHNKDTPCELCPNKRLIDREGNPKKAYLWEYYNHHTGKWYEATVQALILDNNRKIRYEIANDITHRKRDEKSLMQIIK